MCSIAGGIKGVDRMLRVMKHRAPDGENIVEHNGYFMGMGRLAIIDPTNNLFPFEYDSKILSFNGEIYNYIELRKELESLGEKFKTQGDTEVLMKAYCVWGIDCLDKLNGMFAFAILDKKQNKIFLARDIAGEKPLYFRHKNNTLFFASEAKALNFGCEEFPPAHYAIYNLTTDELEIHKWWHFEPNETIIDEEWAEAELERLLEDSINLRTRADVPYALYYSGGVDSTLISTFHEFDQVFMYHDKDYKDEFLRVFPQMVYHLDYPLDSFSAFGLWTLAEMAKKEGVKVVLSGEGADELFGGYVRYVPEAMNLKARDLFPSYKDMFPLKKEPVGWNDFNDKMRGLLRMGDRMAAAHGIENRCPFLDRRIIEFAFSLSPKLRAYGFDTKIILRRILTKRMPEYKHVEKHGLYCSVNEWLGVEDKLSKTEYLKKQSELWTKFQ